MTQSENLSQRWLVSWTGSLLAIAGGIQLVYATVMILAACGAVFVDVGAMLFQGLAQLNKADPEITGAESMRSVANAALNIGIFGLALGFVAIVSGILVIARRELALYGVMVLAMLCIWLAVLHGSMGWHVGTATYGAFVLAFSGFCAYELALRSTTPPAAELVVIRSKQSDPENDEN